MKKRVVFIRSNPIDPDPRVEKQVETLIEDGYHVTILAWDRSSKYRMETEYINFYKDDAIIHRFGIPSIFGGGFRKNLKPLILFQINIVNWLIKNRNMYDIVHACDFDTAYIASKCCKLLSKKFIYDIFDYYTDSFNVPNILKGIIESMDKKTINNADAVIICTEKRIEQIKKSRPKKLYVIHNSPHITKVESVDYQLNKDKTKIVYVGILQEHRLLIELAEIIKERTDLELHIGGFGKLDKYFKELSETYRNIIYYGKLEYFKTISLECSCDIMLAIYDPSIPNHKYAAPNKFYEALMIGKPLIMVNNTGMDDVIKKYNIGEVIAYDKTSLENGINKIIDRKNEWLQISKKMNEIYTDKFSWDEMRRRLKKLYDEI